jgi:hypothetical protein
VNLDDEATIEAVAERLIAQRAVYRKAALEGRRQRKGLVNAGEADVTNEPLLAASQKTARFEHEEKGLGNDQRGVQETKVSALATNLVQVCPLSLISHSNTDQPVDSILPRSGKLIPPCRGFKEGVFSFTCQ